LSDEELDAIRKRKLIQLQNQLAEESNREAEIQEFEKQKNQILRRILSPEARSRLTNIKMVKPELAEQIENQLITLQQSGQLGRAGLKIPISDEQLKIILKRLQKNKRDIKIKFK
jgi:programmed cell death protein 5